MLTINGKTFMNLQEAVAWLLANNALPFQSTASFTPNTEIAKSTIINPSPAEIKIGSLVLFADGKVGTVSGITSNSFIVGSDATDLSDGVPHIVGIDIDASQHLIFTMSEGDPIDAGLVKMVSSMSIDASQHLIVNYNDGTTNDLGAIFQGNVNIAGNFTADSIIENMPAGVSASLISTAGWLVENVYTSVVKTGNKLTLVSAVMITKTDASAVAYINGTRFNLPASIMNALYPVELESGSSYLSDDILYGFTARESYIEIPAYISKYSGFVLTAFYLNNAVLNKKYYVRYEKTFLLNAGLI